jgi:hypothetical protein
LPVGVDEVTEIALFSNFLNTVATNRGSGLARSGNPSGALLLDGTIGAGKTVGRSSEDRVLEVGHRLRSSDDEIVDALSTRRESPGSRVAIGSHISRESKREVNGIADLTLTAIVGNTKLRATIGKDVVVLITLIALFAVVVIDDSISAVGKGTVQTTSIGGGVGVVGSHVALLTGIDNSITTKGQLAVGTASVGDVGITSTEVTLLAGS